MILLGIGSNLTSSYGDRYKNIDLAIHYLGKDKIRTIKKSSYYETFSYPDKKKPKFINVILLVETDLEPDILASKIILVEEKLERKRSTKNAPRTCDIDIIDYKGMIINFKFNNLNFEVPHKKLSSRNFVLFPLQEILPNWKHPRTQMSVKILIDNLTFEDKNSILKIKKP